MTRNLAVVIAVAFAVSACSLFEKDKPAPAPAPAPAPQCVPKDGAKIGDACTYCDKHGISMQGKMFKQEGVLACGPVSNAVK